jgi:uncharacterized membrane protein YfcA
MINFLGRMNMHITLLIILFSLLITFCSSLIQGIAGFGGALISVPLLTLMIAPGVAVPILVIFGTLTGIFIIFKTFRYIKLNEILLLIIMGIVGIPLGVYTLKVIDANILKLIAGIIIFIAALILMTGYKVRMRNKVLSTVIAGFLSGLLNGSLSMSGPPIVLFFSNQGVNKDYFRANITTYGIITNVITIITLAIGGLINFQVIVYSTILTPALIGGVFIGIMISKKVNEKLFRRLTLFLIISVSLVAVITSVCKYL